MELIKAYLYSKIKCELVWVKKSAAQAVSLEIVHVCVVCMHPKLYDPI